MWGIKSITTDLACYSVGINDIAEITDETKEYPDHSEFIFYVLNKNGDILRKIINCPVDIAYGELD
jgi:hypothetical protein